MEKQSLKPNEPQFKGETSKTKSPPDYFKRPTNPTPKNK